ncbi:MAG: hypothetical protein NT074_03395 [Methanomicrobiales archaeon]|nr:hypothetical protein [Methanomicrobiales archaeon]
MLLFTQDCTNQRPHIRREGSYNTSITIGLGVLLLLVCMVNTATAVPDLTTLTPNSAIVGGLDFNLIATGLNFTSDCKIQWDGNNLTTTYVSNTTLNVTIPQSYITSAGIKFVAVVNTTGHEASGILPFTIQNPAPTLTALIPSSKTVGAAGFNLTVTGTNFLPSSTVRWDGEDKTTYYISNITLNATITTSDLTTAGNRSVRVVNPAPGGGISSILTFTIGNSTPTNPAPTASSLTPKTKYVGAAGFNLTVTGTNFLPTSQVRWDGVDKTTYYLSSTSLNATILQSDLAVSGKNNVTVFNPTPGGGSSSPLTFTIKNNLGPVLRSLSPISVIAGRGPFVLTATGGRFLSGSKVQWNGKVRTTTYYSATKLRANILAADVARAGLYQVRVSNLGSGGGFSRNITYLVKNAHPDLHSISPVNVTAGGPSFVLRVTGTNFVRGSMIRWNGSNRATTYLSATKIRTIISRDDIRTKKRVPITVFNPAPGGGTSKSVTLTVV